jgi:hypothetical protein
MRETRLSGSEGGGANPIASPYPYPVKASNCFRPTAKVQRLLLR